MQKIKSSTLGEILNIIKCCLIGIIITLIGTVLLAVILKFANLTTMVIGIINEIIKALAIFIMVNCIRKKSETKILLKSVFAGIIYAILTFVIFSILNGGFVFNTAFVSESLFAMIVSAISSVIISVINRKSV